MPNLEEGDVLQLNFKKLKAVAGLDQDVVVAVAQDAKTKQILIIGFANEEALNVTIKTKKACFYSTSRNELWEKGATSGDVLHVVDVRVNCEQNSLLYLVTPETGAACHTKNKKGQNRTSCFYRSYDGEKLRFIDE